MCDFFKSRNNHSLQQWVPTFPFVHTLFKIEGCHTKWCLDMYPLKLFLLHSLYKKYQQKREVIGLFVVIDLIFVTLLANKGQRIVVTSIWQRRKKTYEYLYKTHYIFLVRNHKSVCLVQFSMFRKKGWPITKIRCLCSRSSGNGSNVSKNNKRQVIGQMDYGMVPKGEKRPENVPFF